MHSGSGLPEQRNICPEINPLHLEQLPALRFGVFQGFKSPRTNSWLRLELKFCGLPTPKKSQGKKLSQVQSNLNSKEGAEGKLSLLAPLNLKGLLPVTKN